MRAVKTPRDVSTSYYLSYRQNTGYYNNVTTSYTTGASLHWRYNSGGSAYRSYFIRMLEPGQIFTDSSAGLVVRAVGPTTIDDGLGNTTNVFTIEVCNDSCDTPMPPASLVARGAFPDTIELSWEDYANGEDGFSIEYSPDGAAWSSLGTAPAEATSYSHNGLSAGTTCFTGSGLTARQRHRIGLIPPVRQPHLPPGQLG